MTEYFTIDYDAEIREREIRKQIIQIPISTKYHANRYDTDDEYVITLWNDEKTYDIRIKK